MEDRRSRLALDVSWGGGREVKKEGAVGVEDGCRGFRGLLERERAEGCRLEDLQDWRPPRVTTCYYML